MFQFIYIHWKSESIKNGFWDSPSSWLTMQKEKTKTPGTFLWRNVVGVPWAGAWEMPTFVIINDLIRSNIKHDNVNKLSSHSDRWCKKLKTSNEGSVVSVCHSKYYKWRDFIKFACNLTARTLYRSSVNLMNGLILIYVNKYFLSRWLDVRYSCLRGCETEKRRDEESFRLLSDI